MHGALRWSRREALASLALSAATPCLSCTRRASAQSPARRGLRSEQDPRADRRNLVVARPEVSLVCDRGTARHDARGPAASQGRPERERDVSARSTGDEAEHRARVRSVPPRGTARRDAARVLRGARRAGRLASVPRAGRGDRSHIDGTHEPQSQQRP